MNYPTSIKKSLPYLLLALILAGGFWFRHYTFWLPHWQGDQSQYITLALKYSTKGLTDYNLSDVEVRVRSLKVDPQHKLVSPQLLNRGVKGDILHAYELRGLSFYDMPLFYKPPMFAAALNMSHHLFTKGNQPYLVVMTNLRQGVNTADKKLLELFYKAQFWAIIVPLASNLAVILLTFFLGRLLFHEGIGLIAAAIMAMNPVSIVTSNRLLIDDFLSMWVLLAFLVFYWAYHRNSFLGSFASGIFLGLALLSKQNAVLLLPAMWLYVFCVSRKVFSPHFLIFAVTGIFLSFSWYSRVFQAYGTPFYHPGYQNMVNISKTIDGKWFDLLARRPHPVILFSVGIPYVCPPMIFGYAALKDLFTEMRATFMRILGKSPWLYLWFWIIFFFGFFILRSESKEERYMLPTYPAIAVLSAAVIDRLRFTLRKFVQPIYIDAFLVLFLVWSVCWGVPMAWETIFDERYLILKPF